MGTRSEARNLHMISSISAKSIEIPFRLRAGVAVGSGSSHRLPQSTCIGHHTNTNRHLLQISMPQYHSIPPSHSAGSQLEHGLEPGNPAIIFHTEREAAPTAPEVLNSFCVLGTLPQSAPNFRALNH